MAAHVDFEVFSRTVNILMDVAEQIDESYRTSKHVESSKRDRLNACLNELSGLDYRHLQLADFKLTHRLFSALTNIPVAEDTLFVKACALIGTILNGSAANPAHQSLHIGLLHRLFDWLIEAMRRQRRVAICDALDTIRWLVRANAGVLVAEQCSVRHMALFDLLAGTLRDCGAPARPTESHNGPQYDSYSIAEITLSAAQCLEALCVHMPLTVDGPATSKCLQSALLGCVDRLYDMDTLHLADQPHCICAAALMNSARLILLAVKPAPGDASVQLSIGELLGAGKAFMMHALPDVASVRKPVRLYVSQQAVSEPPMADATHNRGGKMAKTRKVAKRGRQSQAASDNRREASAPVPASSCDAQTKRIDLMTPSHVTSESDFSESETGGLQRKHAQAQAAVRHSAILLIDAVAQISGAKTIFCYWHAFFPDETLRPKSLALLNCALRDPNARCRAAALHATISCVNGSRTFLTQAENRSGVRPEAYTPFAVALGDMVVSMYEALGQVLAAETSLPVLLQALKCMIVLVQQTTFARLRSGFIGDCIVNPVRKLLRHRDTNIQVAALIVLQELIARGDKTAEIFDIIGIAQQNVHANKPRCTATDALDDEDIALDERIESDSDDEEHSRNRTDAEAVCDKDAQISWLLQVALENLSVASKKPTSIRIESLQVISTMARNFSIILTQLDAILLVVSATAQDSNADVHVQVVKCIDVIGHFMNIYLLDDSPSAEDHKSCQHFWQIATQELLEKLSSPDASSALQSSCCDALSNISVAIFERLQTFEQRFLVCTLRDAAQSPESGVRGAAIRALGVYVMFPTLRDDSHFVESIIESIVDAMPDTNMDLRIKTSWALANVTNAMLQQKQCASESTTTALTEMPAIDADHLKQMFAAALQCRHNDKVRSNAVRALGNLLRLVGAAELQHPYWQDTCGRAIQLLRDACVGSGNMKVKWNACYALGNFMHNERFFDAAFMAHQNWRELVVPTLCKLTVDYPNFKVRINAAAALAVPRQRAQLAEHFLPVWCALLAALEQSDRIVDYNEYQHRDNLVNQLCVSLARYVRMAGATDVVAMASQVALVDSVPAKWMRVTNRIVPERANALLEAHRHLQEMLALDETNGALKALCACFVVAV